jgi:SAM-dependent MidA family methyltransferase
MAERTGNLQSEILGEIAASGPIPFARFMDLCLYHPRHGYYTRGVGGGGGRDYVTSSGLHPAYGILVAQQAEEMWRRLERPERFLFAEFGPGEAQFAADFLAAAGARQEFAAALRYVLIERSETLRERQRRRLMGREGRSQVLWAGEEDLHALRPISGCLFANEVLDAFPVHRVIGTARGPQEVHVASREGRLAEVVGPLSSPAIASFLEQAGVVPAEGQEVDVNLEAPRFVARLLGYLERGYLLVVDYGYEARELYHPARRHGTIRAFHRHRVSEQFLMHPGDQDLTADVDFSAIRRSIERSGGRVLGLTTQSRFLLALGALRFLADPESGRAATDPAAWYREREALKELVLPDRMGDRFRVLIAAAGGAPEDLTGLADPLGVQSEIDPGRPVTQGPEGGPAKVYEA